MSAEERAREGVFLAFQYPVEIPGVSTDYFLRAAVNAVRVHRGEPELGAKEFLDQLRAELQVIILSDTFEQFASPLLRQLGWPTLLCHRLVVENDRIVDYKLRIPEQKQRAVAAFKLLNYHVVAAGDSFNDTAMLTEAHVGFLFRAPANVKQQFPQFKAVEDYPEFLALLRTATRQ